MKLSTSTCLFALALFAAPTMVNSQEAGSYDEGSYDEGSYTSPPKQNPTVPVYDEANFNKDNFKVVTSIADVTLSPTPAPTSPPTKENEILVEVTVVLDTVKTTLTIDVTAEEARSPVMRASLEEGLANSLGYKPEEVSIISIDGVPLDTRRLASFSLPHLRRLAGSAIEFEIASANTVSTDELEATIKAAASSGAIVANMQQAASDNGVLTASLNNMARVLPEPATTVDTKEVVKLQAVDPTTLPTTNAPTPAPTPEEDDDVVVGSGDKKKKKSDTGLIAGVCVAAVVVLGGLIFVGYRGKHNKSSPVVSESSEALNPSSNHDAGVGAGGRSIAPLAPIGNRDFEV